ncbi:ensconsin isoform X1 [Embiotoca jacksoni]|uniref:ensconsin isoform X1 n=1 Tax=Embiotoca jacksoni TaxID=100190 RepID=UPI0037049F4E
MPGSVRSMAVQKKSVIPPSRGPLSTRTVERQKQGRRAENVSNIKPNTKKAPCPAQMYSSAPPRVPTAANGPNINERLRAARERREEHQKFLASREASRLEREQRARRYHQQQLQEKKKKLLEQRLKEERRRAAVEEKRKQRFQEEKERYESAVRRTLEKSQRVQQNQSQTSRGRKINKNAQRRSPLTAWEEKLVSRLAVPTCSYLARSRSAACQSGEEVVHVCRRAVSFHSMNNTNNTTTTPLRAWQQSSSGSTPRRSSTPPTAINIQKRSINVKQIKPSKQQEKVVKKNSNIKPAAVTQSRASSSPSSSSPERTSPRRSISRHSTPMQLELPAVPEEDAAVWSSARLPGNCRPVRTSDEGQQETRGSSDREREASTRTAGDGSPPHAAPQEVLPRPSAGTTDPEEASRLLAERRREARLQREKEEQERLQREEAERRSREELERRRVEERERQQAEAQRLIEEKRRREEEEQRHAEEERAQAMREAALLQKQREEEQEKERARAEQMRQEREIQAQKEEAARETRKKRLEEIMRRTRRTDSPDTKPVSARIEAQPKENTEPVAKLPLGTKAAQLGLNDDDDVVPVVAFKERRSLRTLSGLEEIHQRAGETRGDLSACRGGSSLPLTPLRATSRLFCRSMSHPRRGPQRSAASLCVTRGTKYYSTS